MTDIASTSDRQAVDAEGRLIAIVERLEATIAGENTNLDLLEVGEGGGEYEWVDASATNQTIGATGAAGDYLARVVCVVATALTAQVQIKDGSGTARTILPNSPGGGVGTYVIQLGLKSTLGAWQVTTGAGVTAFAVGRFT